MDTRKLKLIAFIFTVVFILQAAFPGFSFACKPMPNRIYAFIDKHGKYITGYKFDHAHPFSEGLAAVMINNKYGFIDTHGKLVIEPQYEEAKNFSESLAAVKLNNKWGYIDKKGILVIEPQYDYAWPFKENLATVKLNGQLVCINKNAEVAIWPAETFSYIGNFINGIARVCLYKNGKWSFINTSGNYIIEPDFENALDFSEGVAAVKIQENWGFVDRNGDYLIKPSYYKASSFKDDVAVVTAILKKGEAAATAVISEPGPKTFAPCGEHSNCMSPGDIPVEVKRGYIDKAGTFIIEPKYEVANSFSDGLAAVKTYEPVEGTDVSYILHMYSGKNAVQKWGYIDKKDHIVITPEYTFASDFSDGVAAVFFEGLYGYINQDGEMVISPQFEYAEPFSEGFAVVGKDNSSAIRH